MLLGWIQVLPAAEELAGQASSKKSLTVTERITELEQQIKAKEAAIAIIDTQLKQLMSGEVPESMKAMFTFQLTRHEAAQRPFVAAVDALTAYLNKDKDTLNTAIHDLRTKENILLGKSSGGGAAAGRQPLCFCPRSSPCDV